MNARFANRLDAGAQLARRLVPLAGRQDVIVLGIVPGGLVVAEEVARKLDLVSDAFILSPITPTGPASKPVGAVASGGVRVLDLPDISRRLLPRRLVDEESEVAERELSRLEHHYRPGRALADLRDRIVIVVDDIAATGYTLVTACRALRLLAPSEIIAAAPMMSEIAATEIAAAADRCVTVWLAPEPCTPERGYLEFPALTAEAVKQCACQASHSA